VALDCLYLDGRDLRALPLRERRTELEAVVENDHNLIFPARRLAANGLQAWSQMLEAGYEGMVANDDASPYVGGRTLKWLKVKVPQYREGERGWEPKT
jgi:bifunctional non-homologous end joining protein LigD